jgi:hypothetical protein
MARSSPVVPPVPEANYCIGQFWGIEYGIGRSWALRSDPHFIEHVTAKMGKTLIRMGRKMPRSIPIKEDTKRQVRRKLVGPGKPQGFAQEGV